MKYILAMAFLLASFATQAEEEKVGDQTHKAAASDRAMNAAIAHARETLDQFLELAKDPPASASGFKLKVMVSDANGVEHMWFSPFKEIKGGFAGVLADDPEVIQSMESGKVYGFRREQVTDWGYIQDGKQKGSFTVCVLFQSMNKVTVERYKHDYGFECD